MHVTKTQTTLPIVFIFATYATSCRNDIDVQLFWAKESSFMYSSTGKTIFAKLKTDISRKKKMRKNTRSKRERERGRERERERTERLTERLSAAGGDLNRVTSRPLSHSDIYCIRLILFKTDDGLMENTKNIWGSRRIFVFHGKLCPRISFQSTIFNIMSEWARIIVGEEIFALSAPHLHDHK